MSLCLRLADDSEVLTGSCGCSNYQNCRCVGMTGDQTRDVVTSAKNNISQILFDPEPFSLKEILLYPWSDQVHTL